MADAKMGLSSQANAALLQGVGSAMPSSFSASVVADRVMATNLHPSTARTISTAATTTWVYHGQQQPQQPAPVSSQAHTKTVTFSQPSSISYASTSSATTNNNNIGFQGHADPPAPTQPTPMPRHQGQKPGTSLTSTGAYSTATGLRFVTAAPSSFASYQTTPSDTHQHSSNRQQYSSGYTSESNKNQHNASSANASATAQKGSISQGTLGLVNGRLMTFETEWPDRDRKITVVEDHTEGPSKEVKSILKRADGKPKPASAPETRFNVQDSVEIAKKQLDTAGEKKQVRSSLYIICFILSRCRRWRTHIFHFKSDLISQVFYLNPFTASCENAMTLSVPGIPASCEKFPHSTQLNF
jgi:hypothetical protein